MKKAIILGVSIFLFCACVTSNTVKTDKSATPLCIYYTTRLLFYESTTRNVTSSLLAANKFIITSSPIASGIARE